MGVFGLKIESSNHESFGIKSDGYKNNVTSDKL